METAGEGWVRPRSPTRFVSRTDALARLFQIRADTCPSLTGEQRE
jgi:hypothetical protein